MRRGLLLLALLAAIVVAGCTAPAPTPTPAHTPTPPPPPTPTATPAPTPTPTLAPTPTLTEGELLSIGIGKLQDAWDAMPSTPTPTPVPPLPGSVLAAAKGYIAPMCGAAIAFDSFNSSIEPTVADMTALYRELARAVGGLTPPPGLERFHATMLKEAEVWLDVASEHDSTMLVGVMLESDPFVRSRVYGAWEAHLAAWQHLHPDIRLYFEQIECPWRYAEGFEPLPEVYSDAGANVLTLREYVALCADWQEEGLAAAGSAEEALAAMAASLERLTEVYPPVELRDFHGGLLASLAWGVEITWYAVAEEQGTFDEEDRAVVAALYLQGKDLELAWSRVLSDLAPDLKQVLEENGCIGPIQPS